MRISVDIPNSMDDMWKITVDKSDAQLPAVLRNRLKQIVDGLRGKSSKVFRGKGGRIDDPRTVAVWSSRHSLRLRRIAFPDDYKADKPTLFIMS